MDIDWISIGDKCDKEDLIGNIVLPDKVCQGDLFNIWNHSKPQLENATYDWVFDETAIISDTIMENEVPIAISYSDTGLKYITLNIIVENGDTTTITERVLVQPCINSIEEIKEDFSFEFINPFNGTIRGVIDSKVSSAALIVLSDLNGRIIRKQNIYLNKGSSSIVMNSLDLQNGVYLLTVYSEHSRQELKLISTK